MRLWTASAVIARLTRTRMWRGKTLWLSGFLMVVAPLLALIGRTERDGWPVVVTLTLRMPILLAVAVHLSAGVGEEIEDRTYTYLWSRPFPRGALVLGKLLAVVPVLAIGFALSIGLSWLVLQGGDRPPDLVELARAEGAVLGVVVGSGALAICGGALFPKRPLVFVLIYIALGEEVLSFVPLLNQITVAYQGMGLADIKPHGMEVNSIASSIAGLVVLTGLWLGLALWRVTAAEYSSADG